MPRVKICGITSQAEANLAVLRGAAAVGVLVGQRHAADDFLKPEEAAEICASIPPFVTPVLVTHLQQPAEILELADMIPCLAIQVHSDVPPEVLRDLRRTIKPRKLIGKVSVSNRSAIDRARTIEEHADALVLDSIDLSSDRAGGTGLTHDWTISAEIAAESRRPIILAGGLTPTNVADAIAIVRPWAVDVNSGVESPHGRKSDTLMTDFIRIAHQLT